MAHKKKRIFDGLYAQLEETDGNVVLFSARGEPSVIFEITNPVQQLCTDAQQYMMFHDVLSNILQTIGEGYALQKQDILCRQAYHHDVPDDAEFLTRSYFRYFEGREFTEIRTFLILTQEAQRSQFIQYDPKRWLDFHSKVSKTDDIHTPVARRCAAGPRAVLQRELRRTHGGGNGYRFRYGSRGGKLLPGAGR